MPQARVVVNGTPASRAAASSPSHSSVRRALERRVEARRLDQLERREPGGHRDRIAAQRAGLVDRAARRDLLHQVAASAVGADRHAAADDLAERRQVRRDAVAAPARRRARRGIRSSPRRRSAARRAACTARADAADSRRAAGCSSCCRRSARRSGRRCRRRLRRTVACAASKSLYGSVSVRSASAFGTPGEFGTPSVSAPEPALTRNAVAMAVVAAFELHDARAPGGAARERGSPTSSPRCRNSPCAPSRSDGTSA